MIVENENATLVKRHECDDLTSAMYRAQEAAATTGARSFPMVLYKQGRRWCLSGAFDMQYIRQNLERRSAEIRGDVSEAQRATNRPVDKKHAKTIADYLTSNVQDNYIVPPITLNIQKPIDVFTPSLQSDTLAAWVVLPPTTKLSITDGQHRQFAITLASENLPDDLLDELDSHSVAVMITCESDLGQIHQDFADCSKTKALPKSQLAVYDRRNPANGLVLDLINNCPLFQGKIDATSTTLSKTSIRYLLSNQVRQMVKELLVGSYAEPEVSFENKAEQLLVQRGNQKYVDTLALFERWINEVTANIPILEQIACLKENIEMMKIKEWRAEGWIPMTATGLNIIGRIGHEVMRDQPSQLAFFAERLGQVDWSREAPIWQGTIVRSGKITTQQAPLRMAFNLVKDQIGLPTNPEHLLAAQESQQKFADTNSSL